MSNTYWSSYVQLSEELYNSRALRFREDNADSWLQLLQIENGSNVLEVGCGGGIFCHRIKKHQPDTNVTGIDLDSGHIAFAQAKATELGLDCTFTNGNATALPFPDNHFDGCFSHTVMNFCEPNAFVGEQYRVLKHGGKIVIVTVINHDSRPEPWFPDETCEEKPLFDKIWAQAEKNEIGQIMHYETDITNYFAYLHKHGFKNISANTLAVVAHCPDSANVSRDLAMEQINGNRLAEICSVQKATNLAPDALTEVEYETLVDMIHKRWDKRIEQYKKGEKLWDWRVSTVLAISGTK